MSPFAAAHLSAESTYGIELTICDLSSLSTSASASAISFCTSFISFSLFFWFFVCHFVRISLLNLPFRIN